MRNNYIGLALLIILFLSSFMKSDSSPLNTVFDFKSSDDANSWSIMNDVVMGGVSSSTIKVNNDGHGVFDGEVFTVNNGGFASVRYRPVSIDLTNKSKMKIRLKGDGKNYQFRVKKSLSDYESFITTFETSGSWETIEIDLTSLYPSFRGRKLNQRNFDVSNIAELSFLIANKKNETFKLIIDELTIE